MMRIHRSLRAGDALAVAVSAAVTVFFFWYAYAGQTGQRRLYIQEESQTLVYPLSADREVSVSGPLGETHILIRGGSACVADSPCRDKLCLSMGYISRGGGWIACLPNRVFLRVEESVPAEAEVDAAAY
jgi:hypothetical protein